MKQHQYITVQLYQVTGRVVSLFPQLLSRSVFVAESERLSPSLGVMNMGRGGWESGS